MSPLSEPAAARRSAPPQRTPRTCERHGLRYDPALGSGCVLCRRPSAPAQARRRAVRPTIAVGAVLTLAATVAAAVVWRGSLESATAGALPGQTTTTATTTATTAATPTGRRKTATPEMIDDTREGFEKVDGLAVPVVERLFRKWKVEVYLPRDATWRTDGGSHGDRPDLGTLASFVGRVERALSEYPRAYVEAIGFRQLMVVTRVFHRGQPVGMLALGPYHTILAGTRVENLAGLHHEIYHLADYQMLGWPPRDAGWSQLNPPGFRYFGSGRSMAGDHEVSNVRDDSGATFPLPGFVSEYAQADASEDRAELMALMMTRPALVEGRSRTDRLLRAKVEWMRRRLERLTPEMDARFWLSRR